MSWIDNQGYMHEGDMPHDYDYNPDSQRPGWQPPTDTDMYGRKIGTPGAGGDPGDLKPIPNHAPDIGASGSVGDAPLPIGASGNLAGQGPAAPLTVTGNVGTPGYTPQQQLNNHFEYGGQPGGAAEAANRYRKIGEDAQSRPGAVIDTGRSESYGAQAQGNAAAEGRVADLMWNRAVGKTPSIASMRADEDMRRLSAAQTSAAASARGPAALALAQQGAAANTAQGTSQISNLAQINTAQELSDAEKAAYSAYSGMRGQDFQGQSLEQQNAQKQAEIDAAQKAENDKLQMGMTGAEMGVNTAQLGAQGNQIGIATGAQTAANNLQGQKDIASDNRSAATVNTLLGIGGTVAGIGLMGALGGGSGNGSGSGGVGGNGGGDGGGDSGFGSPGSTPGGYDTETGAPVAGSGGGFDPDAKSNKQPVGSGAFGQSAGTSTFKPAPAPSLASTYDPNKPPPLLSSDVRGKADVANEGDRSNRVDAFLDGIHPLSYHYKQAENEPRSTPTGGRYLGISAQDLEKVPDVGHQMVSEGPRGKQIESGPTLSAALAGIARLHERVKDLEGGEHITSDPLTKTGIESEGKVVPLYEDAGTGVERHWDRDVSTARPDTVSGASLSGPAPRYSLGQALSEAASTGAARGATEGARPAPRYSLGQALSEAASTGAARGATEGVRPAPRRRMTDDEARRLIEQVRDSNAVQNEARLSAGPAIEADHPLQEKMGDGSIEPLVAQTYGQSRRSHRFDFGDTDPDRESLGPSGENNRDEPDYNFFMGRSSPLNVANALENDRSAITPRTERYMRREGMWDGKTDALLRDRGLERPDVITSDIRAKSNVIREGVRSQLPVTPEQKAQDDAETAAFMAGSRPVDAAPEEDQDLANRAAYDAREAARAQREAAARVETHAAAQWVDKNDAETARRIRGQSLTPGFIKDWAASRVENRRFAPEAERAERARAYAARNATYDSLAHSQDGAVPEFAGAVIGSTKAPRQPVAFVRGDDEDLERRPPTLASTYNGGQ